MRILIPVILFCAMSAHAGDTFLRATLQGASSSGATDPATGLVSVTLTVPSGGRLIGGGEGWFGAPIAGDRITGIAVKVSGVTVGAFHDSYVATENQGWNISPVKGFLHVDKFSGPSAVPEGAQLIVTGKKAAALSDTLYFNVEWAKQ